MDFKSGKITWDQYTEKYLSLLEGKKEQFVEEWNRLLEEDTEIALACYCKSGDPCHRHLLKDQVKEFIHANGIETFDAGEIDPHYFGSK